MRLGLGIHFSEYLHSSGRCCRPVSYAKVLHLRSSLPLPLPRGRFPLLQISFSLSCFCATVSARAVWPARGAGLRSRSDSLTADHSRRQRGARFAAAWVLQPSKEQDCRRNENCCFARKITCSRPPPCRYGIFFMPVPPSVSRAFGSRYLLLHRKLPC